MLVLEALSALWFWASFSSVLDLPPAFASVLPVSVAAERAWRTPETAWFDPVAAVAWKEHWLQATGCCVDFVFDAQDGVCQGTVRLAFGKSLQSREGWRMGSVVLACGPP